MTIPNGFTALTPFIVASPAAKAIDYYVDVFGARVVSRLEGAPTEHGLPLVGQADLDFGNGRLQLSDPMPEFGLSAPDAPSTGSIVVYVDDVDAVFERAVAGGATVREAPSTFVSGDRYASIVDPFNQRWAIMTRVEDLDDAESERRVKEWWSSLTSADA